MSTLKKENFKLPRIGARIIKSSAAVMLCYVIYILRGKQGIPFYSMLAVLWCIQPYRGKSLTMAIQRATGTLIGAAFGLISILLEIYLFNNYDKLSGYILTSLMIIPVIYVTILLHKQNASYFSCVVFLSITVNHISDANPFIFVANRVFDTFIGIAAAMIINSLSLPHKKQKDTLFIAELDDMLSAVSEQLTPYSKVEINRMLDSGLKFTIATMRTPASLMKPLEGVNINLPVIVMDGAALYDIKDNSYKRAYVMSGETAAELRELIRENGMNCFINALCGDVLMIYYGELKNDAEKSIYEKLRKTPYRNYINREPDKRDRIIYLMLIDETEKVKELREKLRAQGYDGRLKILCYPSQDYPGFSYIKIYNKNASSKNMCELLQESAGASKTVMVGSTDSSDIQTNKDLNSIVKAVKSSFEPFVLKKKKS